ncbi:MAG: type II toxin-antitoxin system VapB family antitoxin [Deltaproteobacteria bacterium]|nr:type II toxin-antitoxin system VapB family antitoxin [Deltaproteobacteria bacterium]MBW2710297.1 type II toxin-antitoxin system VapB family antitoxin [Deltaproteobacteria bacterium]
MRTTLSIDDDVMERARAVATKLRTPFKTVVNEALRAGCCQSGCRCTSGSSCY